MLSPRQVLQVMCFNKSMDYFQGRQNWSMESDSNKGLLCSPATP